MEKEKTEREETIVEEKFECPIGQLFGCLKKSFGPKGEFRRHLYRSKIEFLKAIRSLIDERIEDLEKRAEGSPKKAIKVAIE